MLLVVLAWVIGGIIGESIGWTYGWYFGVSFGWVIGTAIGFAFGGLISAVVLHKEGSLINWKSMLWVTLAWAMGGAFGRAGIVSRNIGDEIGGLDGWAIAGAIGWAISGVIGAFVMIWQIRESNKRKE
jgi:hypothetical protein